MGGLLPLRGMQVSAAGVSVAKGELDAVRSFVVSC